MDNGVVEPIHQRAQRTFRNTRLRLPQLQRPSVETGSSNVFDDVLIRNREVDLRQPLVPAQVLRAIAGLGFCGFFRYPTTLPDHHLRNFRLNQLQSHTSLSLRLRSTRNSLAAKVKALATPLPIVTIAAKFFAPASNPYPYSFAMVETEYQCQECGEIMPEPDECCDRRRKAVWVYRKEEHAEAEDMKSLFPVLKEQLKRALATAPPTVDVCASAARSKTIAVSVIGRDGSPETYHLNSKKLTRVSEYFVGFMRFPAKARSVTLREPYDHPVAFEYFVQFLDLNDYIVSDTHAPIAAYIHALVYKLADRLLAKDLKKLALSKINRALAGTLPGEKQPKEEPTVSVVLHLLEFVYSDAYKSAENRKKRKSEEEGEEGKEEELKAESSKDAPPPPKRLKHNSSGKGKGKGKEKKKEKQKQKQMEEEKENERLGMDLKSREVMRMFIPGLTPHSP
ncbi:hypothetical protein BJ508DRAFT_307557 [Ascobolus immersus RN42]|uniref:BTB domain-containing protein n=1 Tax=Ascobolus immersus RN42 TaxID=1160509 RepID=A0A3N4I2L4_ASCIM|nr:hypothetical protein BJ508DRAFT_307557 [Ascobolus immersus RN42]